MKLQSVLFDFQSLPYFFKQDNVLRLKADLKRPKAELFLERNFAMGCCLVSVFSTEISRENWKMFYCTSVRPKRKFVCAGVLHSTLLYTTNKLLNKKTDKYSPQFCTES